MDCFLQKKTEMRKTKELKNNKEDFDAIVFLPGFVQIKFRC